MPILMLLILICLAVPLGCDGNGASSTADPSGTKTGSPPFNVILISIDTLRADHLAVYGYDRSPAPALERFAEKAVLFERAYSQAPWTTPSHASMFTSLYPSVLGLGNWPNPGKINPKAFTIAELLSRAGYLSAGFLEAGMVSGKFGFAQGFKPYKQGFNHIHESVPACLEWIREQGDHRFFVFLHTYDVHRYDPPDSFRDRFLPDYDGAVEEGIPLARSLQELSNQEFTDTLDEADRRKIVSIYDEGIAYVDHWIGRFLDELEAMDLMDRTVVIITSDHGEEFWEHNHTGHGYTNFEEMLHVPLMIHHPDMAAGRRKGIVRLLDIAPTVAELLGLEAHPSWQGRSFYSILQGREETGTRFNFAEKGHINRKSVQDDRWKLVRTYRSKADDQSVYTDRLFDLDTDPREQNDCSATHPREAERLTALLESWMSANRKIQKGYTALEVEIDPELQEQLEQLGYTGGDR
ncbi:MAG: sulfatase-like hydrolase/transferase [Planctomycetes bacterium]|nr:sulfatase-like hydrolase/transferase [Planctomycetota bacterium]